MQSAAEEGTGTESVVTVITTRGAGWGPDWAGVAARAVRVSARSATPLMLALNIKRNCKILLHVKKFLKLINHSLFRELLKNLGRKYPFSLQDARILPFLYQNDLKWSSLWPFKKAHYEYVETRAQQSWCVTLNTQSGVNTHVSEQ